MHMQRLNIPATSGNMGVGFDTIGFAMELYNSIDFEISTNGNLFIEQAAGETNIPCGTNNLIYKSACKTAEIAGKKLPPLHLIQHNRIPMASGLGSSAACIVGGVMIASSVLDLNLSREQMLDISALLEGHPDNAAPAIYGGITVSQKDENGFYTQSLPLRGDLAVCIATPDISLSTRESRKALPQAYSPADTVNNIACTALLVSAIYSGDYTLLDRALRDRLHQPYRKHFIPGFDAFISCAMELGAYGACLSGAGPTMLCFIPFEGKDTFAEKMKSTFAENTANWRIQSLELCKLGAHYEKSLH